MQVNYSCSYLESIFFSRYSIESSFFSKSSTLDFSSLCSSSVTYELLDKDDMLEVDSLTGNTSSTFIPKAEAIFSLLERFGDVLPLAISDSVVLAILDCLAKSLRDLKPFDSISSFKFIYIERFILDLNRILTDNLTKYIKNTVHKIPKLCGRLFLPKYNYI